MKKKNTGTRLLGILVALSMAISTLSVNVMAATEICQGPMVALVKESDEDYQEALKVLGISEEEAAKCNIYSVDASSSSDSGISTCSSVLIPENGICNFGKFEFYGSNTGGFWTIQGSKMRWGVKWSGTYDTSTSLMLGIYLYRYRDGSLIDSKWLFNNGNTYATDWFSVEQGDYQFQYYSKYAISKDTNPWCTVQMYVASKSS